MNIGNNIFTYFERFIDNGALKLLDFYNGCLHT